MRYFRYDYEDGSYSISVIRDEDNINKFADSTPVLTTEVTKDDYVKYMNWKYQQLTDIVIQLTQLLNSITINDVKMHFSLFKLKLNDGNFIELNCASIIDCKLKCSITNDEESYYDIVIENSNVNINLVKPEWDDDDDILIHLKTPIVKDNVWLVEPS